LGLIKSSPQRIATDGTHWRYLGALAGLRRIEYRAYCPHCPRRSPDGGCRNGLLVEAAGLCTLTLNNGLLAFLVS
jgi:hypothetical protein